MSDKCLALKVLALIFLAGCSGGTENAKVNTKSYQETVESAGVLLPQAVEMESLFGDADHFITHFAKPSSAGPRKWNTEVHFGGRYSLTMQVDVEVDYASNRISKVVSDPEFFLIEHEKVNQLPDKRFDAHLRELKVFGPEEWEKFHESEGKFASLGLKKNDKPVELFDRYVDSARSASRKISLLKGGQSDK